jgi:hypothetical protein
MVFKATFNNISFISWRSVVLVEETRVHREVHRPVASYCMTNFITALNTISHNHRPYSKEMFVISQLRYLALLLFGPLWTLTSPQTPHKTHTFQFTCFTPVSLITNIVSSNSAHGEVNSIKIQLSMIKFCHWPGSRFFFWNWPPQYNWNIIPVNNGPFSG